MGKYKNQHTALRLQHTSSVQNYNLDVIKFSRGPPHIYKVKKYEIVLSFKVSLFEFLFFLNQSVKLSLPITIYSQKLYIAPLNVWMSVTKLLLVEAQKQNYVVCIIAWT